MAESSLHAQESNHVAASSFPDLETRAQIVTSNYLTVFGFWQQFYNYNVTHTARKSEINFGAEFLEAIQYSMTSWIA